MTISDFLVQIDCSIKEAMHRIDRNTKGIVYVVQNEEFIGVITDGDVRRFLMEDGDLNEKVSVIMNKNPRVLDLANEKKADSLMKFYKIKSIF